MYFLPLYGLYLFFFCVFLLDSLLLLKPRLVVRQTFNSLLFYNIFNPMEAVLTKYCNRKVIERNQTIKTKIRES